ncbi:MAG: hypothetical protein AAF636_00185 [Pseudomonadota bacterium]
MRLASIPISFRTIQVLSDLRSAAAKGLANLNDYLSPDQCLSLKKVVFDQKAKFKRQDVEILYGDILRVSKLPDTGLDALLSATALLLADRLQEGAGKDDLRDHWDKFQGSYRAASAPVRAAVMNGFSWAHTTRRANLNSPPAGTDLRTYNAADLLSQLQGIACAMPEDAREAICALAAEGTVEVHRRALENCLAGSCILSEFGGWFPGEVVEMASLDPGHPGFPGSMALIMIDAISTRDAAGRMAKCWEDQAEDFNVLLPNQRAPLIAGVRHLHEMGFGWQPYADWSALEITEKAIVVPFAKA